MLSVAALKEDSNSGSSPPQLPYAVGVNPGQHIQLPASAQSMSVIANEWAPLENNQFVQELPLEKPVVIPTTQISSLHEFDDEFVHDAPPVRNTFDTIERIEED